MAAAVNVLKIWLLLAGLCALLGGIGWVLGGYRLLSIFVFCGLLAGAATYWYAWVRAPWRRPRHPRWLQPSSASPPAPKSPCLGSI